MEQKRAEARNMALPSCLKGLSCIIIMLIASATALNHAHAQEVKQYQRQFTVGNRLQATILVIGWKRDSADIEKLFDVVAANANISYSRLNWQDPSSEVFAINANAGKGPVSVSPEVLLIFEAAEDISGSTGGAFDITYAGPGTYRDVKIKKGPSSVEIRKEGVQVRLDHIMDGYLADLIIDNLYAANMRNAIVRVENVFRAMGQGLGGPWKIQIADDEGTYAHHSMDIAIARTGIATVSANQYRDQRPIDPRTREAIAPACRGVTVAMREAAKAQGVAHAIFILGPDDGYRLISKLGNAKGVIVDDAGNFIRSPGF